MTDGEIKGLKFCPCCGNRTLWPYVYRSGTKESDYHYCTTCGVHVVLRMASEKVAELYGLKVQSEEV